MVLPAAELDAFAGACRAGEGGEADLGLDGVDLIVGRRRSHGVSWFVHGSSNEEVKVCAQSGQNL